MTVTAAELDSDRRNALDDSDFAVPGKRKLPINDAAHVRNAIARFKQTQGLTAEEREAAKGRIKGAAKKFGVEVADDFAERAEFGEPLLVACAEQEVGADAFAEGKPLPFVRIGEFTFTDYGEIAITDDDLDVIVRNFQANARRQDLPLVNEEHIPATYSDAGEVQMGPGAVGWIKDLYRDGDTVMFVPDWNAAGERLLEEDRYRGVSPELLLNWTDPETGEAWGLTAAGVALTNKPRMKSLAVQGQPLAAGEGRVLAYAERPYLFSAPTAPAEDATDAGEAPAAEAVDEPVKATEVADVHVDAPMAGLSVAYAYPARKRLPLHSAEAVKGARARFMSVDASEQERDDAWGAVREAAQRHGVEVPADWRLLRASESAQFLMQEMGDDTAQDVAAGQLAPCCYQPPYSDIARCPGFTRSDPDNDGDSDCCLMAGRGCNGYIPLVLVESRAAFVSPQSPTYYRERSGGPELSDKTSTKKEDQPAVTASEPAQPATEPAAEPAPATPAADASQTQPADSPPATEPAPAAEPTEPAAKAEPEPAGAGAQAAANLAEVQSILAAERREREAMATRLAAAEQSVQTERDARLRMEAATKLAEVAGRVESLVRTGRITPAQRDLLMAEPAKFTEDEGLLKVLEAAPENGAVDMRERGSGAEESVPESDRLERAAKALMAERQQSVDPNDSNFFPNYKRALLDVGRTGYRAR